MNRHFTPHRQPKGVLKDTMFIIVYYCSVIISVCLRALDVSDHFGSDLVKTSQLQKEFDFSVAATVLLSTPDCHTYSVVTRGQPDYMTGLCQAFS